MPHAPEQPKPTSAAPTSSSVGSVDHRYSGADSVPTIMPSVGAPRRPRDDSERWPIPMDPKSPPAFSATRYASGGNFIVPRNVAYQNVIEWYEKMNAAIRNDV